MAHLLRRITASVSLLDDGFGSGVIAEDAHRQVRAATAARRACRRSPAISWQDVLTLHELLETDASIEHIAEPPQGSS